MQLFSKHREPMCVYCARGRRLSDDEILCKKVGVVAPDHRCRRFEYDPLRRIPSKPVRLVSTFQADDFKTEE